MKLMNPLTVDLGKRLISINRGLQAKNNAVLHKQDLMTKEAKKLVKAAKAEMKASEMVDAGKLLGVNYDLDEAHSIIARKAEMAKKYGHLKQERIFNIKAIEKICRRYGLRFLPSFFYKGAMDEGIPDAIQSFQMDNGGTLPSGHYRVADHFVNGPLFMIAAPKSSFALQPRPVDPLLFICIDGEGKEFYLIHKWGNDLAFYRPVMNWMGEWYGVPAAIAGVSATFACLKWNELWVVPNNSGMEIIKIFAGILAVIAVVILTCWAFSSSDHDDPEKWCSRFKD